MSLPLATIAPPLAPAKLTVTRPVYADQELKGKLRRYEAVKVPQDLRKERLFEVRFFEGLPQ